MIRPYSKNDLNSLIALIRLNTPEYFVVAEEADFVSYLNEEIEDYYVFETQNQVIGCGGINYTKDGNTAVISWDIIHPDHQGKGIGKELLLYRINHISSQKSITSIIVRTSQLTYKFYEKFGFITEKTQQDFWAEGIDLYQMKMMV